MAVNDLGTVKPGSTILLPFHTFDSNDPSASVTLTGLALADVGIYKGTSMTERASTTGVVLLDTDGIDIDATTGIHGLSIDLSSNATAGFYAAGSRYYVTIASVTVDAATVNFVLGTFYIGYPGAILDTTIAAYTSTDNFTLNTGSADNDAYNGCILVAHDVASAVQTQIGIIEDYTGSTKTVNLKADPGIFTMTANDNISIFPPALVPTIMGTTLDVTATGAAGIDWGNVENPTTAVDLSGTDIQLADTVTTVTTATNLTNAPTSGDLTATMKTSVNTEVLDVLNTDTITLPGQEAPPLAPTHRQAIGWLYKVLRNRKAQTATEWRLYADDESTVDAKATVSDDTSTAIKQEIVTGP